MLGQSQAGGIESSSTLPRLDGQDEDGEAIEGQFEILSLANSCPDLSILEEDNVPHNNNNNVDILQPLLVGNGLVVVNTNVVSSGCGTVRRSTSLSSLGVDCVDGNHPIEKSNGCSAPHHHKVVGDHQKEGNDFARNSLRSSTSEYRHMSMSTPSVAQFYLNAGVIVGRHHPHHHNQNNHSDNFQKLQSRLRTVQSDAHQHITKRSFFRRKNKTKSTPVVIPSRSNNMDIFRQIHTNGDSWARNGFSALLDPALGLQDPDAECWTLSMSHDLVSQLDEKEVKRQEHMYELILTEKHHCLTLALMQHLFVGDMKKSGYGRYARLLFPELNKLLEVHFTFLRRMRERQTKFRELGQPLDTLADILYEQFTSDQYQLMIRLYGLLCASHTKSLLIFKDLLKDPKFASLVSAWDKETLLGRKNVRECLLLVAQRITKYPLLIEPILKTSRNVSPQERDKIEKALQYSKDLITNVNQRVAQRENLLEVCQKIEAKSYAVVGQKRIGRDYLMSLPSRRLLFHGQAIVTCNRFSNTNANVNRNFPCSVLILTDALVFMQEISLKFQFVSPPGLVMLNNLIVRENAGQNSSLFLVLGTGTSKPEMIELQVISPSQREIWMEQIRNAISRCVEEAETGSDGDEEVDPTDISELKVTRALEELQEQDKQLIGLLRSRAKLIDSLKHERPYHWTKNNLDGKDSLLSSLSETCNEVQRVLTVWESNSPSSVIRSTSCVGDHVSQLVLPKRADTFAGFDSQQRLTGFDLLPHCANNKLLLDLVTQLYFLCGEMFSQMIPQLMPSVYQTHTQLQRRMEELREAQQRLETEKALFQQDLMAQKEIIEREKTDLVNLKQALQQQQEDITQQREQLYRKLEALQKQGYRTLMDPISPLSANTSLEKLASNPVPSRRPLPTPPAPPNTAPSNGQQPAQNGVKNRQQLPLFLASNSSFKAKAGSSSAEVRMKGPAGLISPNSGNGSPQDSLRSAKPPNPKNSVGGVTQLLPLRLSEGTPSSQGNGTKTASLPRGVGSRSVSSMLNQMESSGTQNSNQFRTSSSTSAFPYPNGSGGDNNNLMPFNTSFLYGPSNGRQTDHTDGDADNNVTVIHRRSGSSPVPMSSAQIQMNVRRPPPQPEVHYHQHQHPFFRQREDEAEKILFL